MRVIIAKEQIDKYGFKYLVYKDGRKKVLEISYPSEYSNGYRVCGRNFAFGLKQTLEECKLSAIRFLTKYYSVFGGCEIIDGSIK